MTTQRLQKILAAAGYGSRRACEQIIAQGRVVVNGATATLGQKGDPLQDDIRVDGKPLRNVERKRYILLNKPTGYLSSRRSQGGHPTVLKLVKADERLFPVGRLDLDSEGLMLLTNDGELTNLITHPRYEIEKEYLVQVRQQPDEAQLDAWREGVVLEDGERTQQASVDLLTGQGGRHVIRIVIREGKKRHIRRSAKSLGLNVVSLKRIRIGPLTLGDLASGSWRELDEAEVRQLRTSIMPIAGRGKSGRSNR